MTRPRNIRGACVHKSGVIHPQREAAFSAGPSVQWRNVHFRIQEKASRKFKVLPEEKYAIISRLVAPELEPTSHQKHHRARVCGSYQSAIEVMSELILTSHCSANSRVLGDGPRNLEPSYRGQVIASKLVNS
ncbi:hypothetical protein TNCV_4429151 [Trichonephila clavipes]|nr:hypothetical protein TNCV_4429151 [Trichonephila clavipes]